MRCLRPNIEACGKCGEVLDVYGDHAVTCKRNNFHTRHQLVVDALASVPTSADIPLEMDVAINGKERPADILARRLKGSAPLAIYITVVHPFTQTSDTTQHDRVSSAELAKHGQYDQLCRASGFSFNACGFSTFGGAAPDALLVLRYINNHIMEKNAKSEGHLLCNQAGERIVVALMRGIAAQLI